MIGVDLLYIRFTSHVKITHIYSNYSTYRAIQEIKEELSWIENESRDMVILEQKQLRLCHDLQLKFRDLYFIFLLTNK